MKILCVEDVSETRLHPDAGWALKYHTDTKTFTAGCREFGNKKDAIEHWKRRIEEETPYAEEGSSVSQQNIRRAKQFITALRKFRVPK